MPVAPGWVPLKVLLLLVTVISLSLYACSVFTSQSVYSDNWAVGLCWIRLWLACDRAVLGPGPGVPADWSPSCPALLRRPGLLRDHQSPLQSPGHNLTESPADVPQSRPLRHTPQRLCWWMLLMLWLMMTSTWALNSTLVSRPQLKQNHFKLPDAHENWAHFSVVKISLDHIQGYHWLCHRHFVYESGIQCQEICTLLSITSMTKCVM